MAAIQVALQAGAEVFATAGSPGKRALLSTLGVSHVMDSRSLEFSSEIRYRTRGEGVHVVLNSLAGEFIPASIDVLAPGGRFVEMGKRDIWTAEDVAHRRPDVTYFPFDLADVAASDPALIQELFAELVGAFDTGALRPLPVTTFPLADAASAFRTMAHARHTGKLVVVHPGAESPSPAPRADGTYLVTGGLGALGLATARWLVSRGAPHVVLLGRSAPDEPARTAIEGMRAEGATIRVASVDVTDARAVDELFRSLASGAFPVRGILHAAGIVDDGTVLEQTWARAARVLAPKTVGASLLARHARDLELDFFVCYSSATGIFGSPGQSTYAAANAYLDALCHELRGAGIPATSVQWGPWRDGGMAAARSAPSAARWSDRGVQPMGDDIALAALELALASATPEVAVLSVDWRLYGARLGAAPARALLGELVKPSAPPAVATASFLPQLKAAPSGRRRALLIEHARTLALRILGLEPATAVDEGRPLKELGLDSLMAVELRNALGRSLESSLPATLAFDHPTLAALADYLQGRLFGAETRPPVPMVTDEAGAIGTLSDEAAEKLLLAELDSGDHAP
jgi:NADPH:quinone reductase-like Zn-dependent oxidoreductase/acyl carrier protein